jgi:hypothetical protein
MIVCIQSPSRLPMKHDQKSLTHHWLSCSRWGREHVTLVFSYNGGWFIRKGHWRTKVNNLQFPVGYQNVTINRNTWHTEPEIRTNESSQLWHNLQFDGYGSGIGPSRRSSSGYGTVLKLHSTYFVVRTRTAGRLPKPIAYTRLIAHSHEVLSSSVVIRPSPSMIIHHWDILVIVKARLMSGCSSCTHPHCLSRVADVLRTYKMLVAASKNVIWQYPLPYLTL